MLNSPWSILLYYVLKYALLSHISTLDIVNGQIFQGTYFSLAIDTIALLSTAKRIRSYWAILSVHVRLCFPGLLS